MARVLALDFGEVRIGVALSDATGMLASPLTIIEQITREQAVQDVVKIVREREVVRIIIGFPYSLDGSIGPQADEVQEFATALEKQTTVPIEFRDERFTTTTAMDRKREGSKKKLGFKIRYDAMAAAVILQEYLDEHRNNI
jgi:putative Holliday junction resolvase